MTTAIKAMTDVQILETAEKLIKSSDVKTALPPNHTLADLWRSARVVQTAGIAFIQQYGERLRVLDPVLWRDLAEWENLAI